MAAGNKTINPITAEPEIELADGSKVTDWNALKATSVSISGSFHGKFSTLGVLTFTETPGTTLIQKQPDNQTFRLFGGASGTEFKIQGAFSKNDNGTHITLNANEDEVLVATAGTGGGNHWKGGSSWIHRVAVPAGESRDYSFVIGNNGNPSGLTGSIDIEAQTVT